MRFLATCLLFTAACASDVALGGPNTLVRTDFEPAGEHCAGGGVAINTGLDVDGDTYLDDAEITSTQYVCNGSSLVQCAGGNILAGTIQVRTAADFGALASINCIDGDLLIAGTDVDKLPLTNLEIVTGDLVIAGNNALTTLDGLTHLREVGRKVLVQVNPELADVGALGGIERADEVSLVGNDALTDLVGLEAMVHLRTTLTITNNGGLRSLAGLDNLLTASRPIVIRGNRSLASVDALDRLRSAQLIDLSGNGALRSISLDALEKVDVRLIVSANVALTTVALPALSTVGDFVRIEGNNALTSLTSPGLLSVGSVLVNDDASLATVDFAGLVFATQSVELANLPALSSARFDRLTSIGGQLRLSATPQLSSLAGFGRLGSIAGAFVVDRTGLPSFAGMGALGVVAGDLLVTGNGQLTSFAGLTALHDVGEDLTITDNSSLLASVAQAFAQSITVHGTTTIH